MRPDDLGVPRPIVSRRASGRDRGPSRTLIGRRAELAVIDYLFVRGFVILAANVRLQYLELDVVARRGPLAVIVEVRTRGTTAWEKSLASLNGKKQMRILRAADRLWRSTLSKIASIERLRIDVAAVTFDGPATYVEYIEGALSA